MSKFIMHRFHFFILFFFISLLTSSYSVHMLCHHFFTSKRVQSENVEKNTQLHKIEEEEEQQRKTRNQELFSKTFIPNNLYKIKSLLRFRLENYFCGPSFHVDNLPVFFRSFLVSFRFPFPSQIFYFVFLASQSPKHTQKQWILSKWHDGGFARG